MFYNHRIYLYFRGWFYHFTVVLVVTNTCINPFIYAAKYREFQNGVRRLVACVTRRQVQIQPQVSSNAVQASTSAHNQP